MSENNKLRNFLVNGFQSLDPRDDRDDGAPVEEPVEVPVTETVPVGTEDRPVAQSDRMESIESELIRLRFMLEDMRSQPSASTDLSAYMTTKEQNKATNAAIARVESSISNKTLVNAMEQISVMREDFHKLCLGMRARLDSLDAEKVLSSFEAYAVDMENILNDAGVYIGAFEYDRLNTLHQRIVGVVPTGEKEKDGTIAERQSDGYKLGDKVLLKEKVTVYKFDKNLPVAEDPQVETSVPEAPGTEETPLETVSSTVDEPAEENVDESQPMEVKE